MNHNETRTLWVSIGAALFAVFLLYSYTNERTSEMAQKFAASRTVVVATKNINEMQTIDATMLAIKSIPVDYIQPGALSQPNGAVGMVALAPIRKGEQILRNKIMEPGPITGLSLQVTPGKRAVAIPIDSVHGVSKLIKPGDHIDLVAAVNVGSGPTAHKVVRTIMQNVPVLATGLRIINQLPRLLEDVGNEAFIKNIQGDTKYSTITVEVSPQQAQNLIYILATSPGSLFITLRHPTDSTEAILTDSDLNTVLDRVNPSLVPNNVRTPASVPMPRPVQPRIVRPVRRVYRRGGFVNVN